MSLCATLCAGLAVASPPCPGGRPGERRSVVGGGCERRYAETGGSGRARLFRAVITLLLRDALAPAARGVGTTCGQCTAASSALPARRGKSRTRARSDVSADSSAGGNLNQQPMSESSSRRARGARREREGSWRGLRDRYRLCRAVVRDSASALPGGGGREGSGCWAEGGSLAAG